MVKVLDIPIVQQFALKDGLISVSMFLIGRGIPFDQVIGWVEGFETIPPALIVLAEQLGTTVEHLTVEKPIRKGHHGSSVPATKLGLSELLAVNRLVAGSLDGVTINGGPLRANDLSTRPLDPVAYQRSPSTTNHQRNLEICQRLRDGEKQADLAREYVLSPGRVATIWGDSLRMTGWASTAPRKRNPHWATPEQIDQMLRMRQAGTSVAEISKTVGIAGASIYVYLRRAGFRSGRLPPVPGGRKNKQP